MTYITGPGAARKMITDSFNNRLVAVAETVEDAERIRDALNAACPTPEPADEAPYWCMYTDEADAIVEEVVRDFIAAGKDSIPRGMVPTAELLDEWKEAICDKVIRTGKDRGVKTGEVKDTEPRGMIYETLLHEFA